MELDTILENLGGDKSVAEKLGCGVSAISNWKVRGIPTGRKFDLLALAERAKVVLTITDVEAADRFIAGRRANPPPLAAAVQPRAGEAA